MLAILDPRLDRHTLTRRGTFMTAVIVALLTLPLAALRPFQQPTTAAPMATAPAATTPAVTTTPTFPESFKVSISDAKDSLSALALSAAPALKAANAQQAGNVSVQSMWSCDKYPVGTSRHINSHSNGSSQISEFLISSPGHCTEAAIVGKAVFSPDETRIAQLSPGGFARFRERTETFDRAVSVTPVGDGSLSYTATVSGRTVPFDDAMVAWLSRLLPEILREAAINVPERVARLRAQGGVAAVLREIALIHSSGAKAAHYEELIKNGPTLSSADLERITQQVGRDLTSSGDLSRVLQMLPRSALQNPGARQSIASALSAIKSSGDKATTLQILAPNADREMLLVLAKAAESLPSSGDKANFLIATASEYLTPGSEPLRNAYFKTASTLQSSGDMANVLISAMPYGHSSLPIAVDVVETSRGLKSSGDAANVLISLVSQRLLDPRSTRATLAAIDRTLTMGSSGDRANVLIAIANANLLSTSELRDAYARAAMALPSEGDRANALTAAARR